MHKNHMSGLGIVPVCSVSNFSYKQIMENYSRTCFEARNVADGAYLYQRMVNEGDTIWLGIAGAGIVGGLGGEVIELLKRGYVDAICTTGAQVYHDLHFAYDLPVKQGHPEADDNKLRRAGVTRIYDIYIDEKGTLLAQDKIIRKFCETLDGGEEFSSAGFNNRLGNYVLETADFPERSFLAQATEFGVPVFFDSNANHSVALNVAALYFRKKNRKKIEVSANLDILESAAITYGAKSLGFVELGGGGPKNFIQQTGPTIKQTLGIDFEGADRGLQITTALKNDGGLSGCTFSEGVTWGKYKKASRDLVQIYSEYSIVFPLIAGYVFENCEMRARKRLIDRRDEMLDKLKGDIAA